MSRLEELPPDQRAALSLLLRQRKSYAEVAAMLRIPPGAVHDRAHAALAVLAVQQARALDPPRRLEIGDYLLGQASVSERLRTRTYLGGSEPAREWARTVAAELAPLTDGKRLPDIPGASSGAEAAGGRALSPAEERTHPPPSSRLGGALILAAIVVAIVVAVVLLTTGGGKASSHHKANGPATSAKGPGVHQIALHAPRRGKQVGVVEVLTEAGKRAFYIEADHLPESKGFFYAIWLYNSPTSAEALVKASPVGKSHRLAGGALLPTNAGSFGKILLTRETKTRPTHPGPVVLQGAFSL